VWSRCVQWGQIDIGQLLRKAVGLSTADADGPQSSAESQVSVQLLTPFDPWVKRGEADFVYAVIQGLTNVVLERLPAVLGSRQCAIQVNYAVVPGRQHLCRIAAQPLELAAVVREGLTPVLSTFPAWPVAEPLAFSMYVPHGGASLNEESFLPPFADLVSESSSRPLAERLAEAVLNERRGLLSRSAALCATPAPTSTPSSGLTSTPTSTPTSSPAPRTSSPVALNHPAAPAAMPLATTGDKSNTGDKSTTGDQSKPAASTSRPTSSLSDASPGSTASHVPTSQTSSPTPAVGMAASTSALWPADDDSESPAGEELLPADCDRLLALSPRNLPALWLRSRLRAQQEQFQQAIDDLTTILAMQPNASLALAVRAECYYFLDRPQEAQADLTAALQADPELWRAHQLKAELARQQGRFVEALDHVELALRGRPDYAPFYVTRGLIQEDRGDLTAAIDDYTQAVTLDPQQAPPLLARARVRLRQNDRTGALRDLDRLVELQPRTLDVRRWRAGVRFERSLYQGVVDDLTVVLDAEPLDVDARLLRGRAFGSLGKQELAIDDFTAVLMTAPDHAEAYAWRSLSQLAVDRIDEAQHDSDQALDLGQSSARLHWIRALIARSRDETERALAECQAALEIDPELAEARDLRGQLRAEQGDIEEALEDFSAAIESQPDSPELWTRRAAVRLHEDQWDEAIADATAALERNADFLPALFVRAQAWEKQLKLVAAIQDLDRLLARDEDSIEALALRAQLRLRQSQLTLAAADLASLRQLRPNDETVALMSGWIHCERKEYRQALELCERLLAHHPEFAMAWVLQGQARTWLDGPAAADDDYRQAMALDPDRSAEIAMEQSLIESSFYRDREAYDEAIAAAERALEHVPQARSGLMARGAALWSQRQLVAAAEDFAAVLQEDPLDAFAQSAYGCLLAELGESDLARVELSSAITALTAFGHDRALAAALSGKALMEIGLQNWRAAQELLEAAIVLSPGHPWIHYHWGLWHHGQGDELAARWCFRLALVLTEPRLPPYRRSQIQGYLARPRPQSPADPAAEPRNG
jgi:tetratricopeptide (TPR) repeat protein